MSRYFLGKETSFEGISFNHSRQDRGLIYDCCAEQNMGQPLRLVISSVAGKPNAEARAIGVCMKSRSLSPRQILRAVALSIGSGSEEPCFSRAGYEAMSGVYNVRVSPEK